MNNEQRKTKHKVVAQGRWWLSGVEAKKGEYGFGLFDHQLDKM